MEKIKAMIPFLIAIILDFYLLPLLIKDTGIAMLMLLIIIPLICFICSFIYGIKRPFSIFYSVIVAFLFLPSILIFYNSSAWVYSIGYGVVALFGSFIGNYAVKRAK
ncbi:hypothetical protein [Proteiniborus sp. MB09-C3]|uniref:hypothetical protein n=1 Tax=Proteiniborus sp. MB09-C3 TaxID=3050072 RepID=UPI0025548299|nr:hypothetical protein [Proteiniborus sp. MB09-C3]WIV11530.1 hypothetical protein QO263_15725 [Proteiniborus sp. MB09-C3]